MLHVAYLLSYSKNNYAELHASNPNPNPNPNRKHIVSKLAYMQLINITQ